MIAATDLDQDADQMQADEPKTRTVRLMSDLVMALETIKYAERLEGRRFSVVEYLDSICRRPVMAREKRARDIIDKHK